MASKDETPSFDQVEKLMKMLTDEIQKLKTGGLNDLQSDLSKEIERLQQIIKEQQEIISALQESVDRSEKKLLLSNDHIYALETERRLRRLSLLDEGTSTTVKTDATKTQEPEPTNAEKDDLETLQEDDSTEDLTSILSLDRPRHTTALADLDLDLHSSATSDDDDIYEDPPTQHFLDVTVPPAPMSPYHLVYEVLSGEPWKVLLASVLIKKIYSTAACSSMVLDFFVKFPTLESIQKDKMVEFFTGLREPVARVDNMVLALEEVAQSLLARVAKLEYVPHCNFYSRDVYKIFCLRQVEEKDLETLSSYDLKSYIVWSLAQK